MAGRLNTWWVGYTYGYEYFDTEENDWLYTNDIEAGRFRCLKKDIRREVEKAIRESLEGERIRNLKFDIYEQYITTDCEV
jgi:hypothetical protein